MSEKQYYEELAVLSLAAGFLLHHFPKRKRGSEIFSKIERLSQAEYSAAGVEQLKRARRIILSMGMELVQ